MPAVLALDQGTTSSRAIVFNADGQIVALQQREFRQIFPRPGWVEHDAEEIWASQLEVAQQALRDAGLAAEDVAAIGITNQRETTLVWDRATGRPIHNAIVWQDRRTADFCDSLIEAGHAESIRSKTGLVIDAYFSASKLKWLLDHVPEARSRAERGELAFGTIDSWLLWKLTGGRLHVTDISNACRTMLLDIHTRQWDPQLLEMFDVPAAVLPEVRGSSEVYGHSLPELFGGPIALAGAAGDQHAALFGQNCDRPGLAKNTYGTGCFALLHVGDEPIESRSRLLTTAACDPAGGCQYALEGSIFIAGAAVQWLRDGLAIIGDSSEVEQLAGSVDDADGVYLVPAFAGLGAPHWDPHARGLLIGMTRGTTRAHIARATLESIAFQVADVLDAMRRDSGCAIDELRVDGGACVNNLLMQFQADILQTAVVRPKVTETTALGAAFLAGLAVKFWKDADEIRRVHAPDRIFKPQMPPEEAAQRRARWSEAVRRAGGWARVSG